MTPRHAFRAVIILILFAFLTFNGCSKQDHSTNKDTSSRDNASEGNADQTKGVTKKKDSSPAPVDMKKTETDASSNIDSPPDSGIDTLGLLLQKRYQQKVMVWVRLGSFGKDSATHRGLNALIDDMVHKRVPRDVFAAVFQVFEEYAADKRLQAVISKYPNAESAEQKDAVLTEFGVVKNSIDINVLVKSGSVGPGSPTEKALRRMVQETIDGNFRLRDLTRIIAQVLEGQKFEEAFASYSEAETGDEKTAAAKKIKQAICRAALVSLLVTKQVDREIFKIIADLNDGKYGKQPDFDLIEAIVDHIEDGGIADSLKDNLIALAKAASEAQQKDAMQAIRETLSKYQ